MIPEIFVPSTIGIDFLGISYSLGSAFEKPGEFGTHHLMEHLMCKSFDHLLPLLKRLGIDYNAFTADTSLAFWFQGLTDSLEQVSNKLYNLIISGKHTWTEEEFLTEKSTVLQEYEDCFNNQIGGTITNSIRKYYNYYGAIGLRDDIENFTYEQSLEFRKNFNVPTFICQVGTRHINNNEFIKATKPTNIFQKPTFGEYSTKQEIVPKEGKTIIGLLGKNPLPKQLTNRISIIINCLTGGLESPLYQEIREKRGLSYASYGYADEIGHWGIPSFLACTSNKNGDELEGVYTEFFSGDLKRHVSQERFNDYFSEIKVAKKKCDILPHDGVKSTVMQESPFEGLDNFSYDEAIYLLEKYLHLDNFVKIKY